MRLKCTKNSASQASPPPSAPEPSASISPPPAEGTSSPDLLFELLADENLEALRSQAKKMLTSETLPDFTTTLDVLLNGFHNIRGVGRYTHLTHIEALCESIEILVNLCQSAGRVLEPTLRTSIVELIEQTIRLLQRVKTENKALSSPELVNEFVSLTGQVGLLTQLLKEVTKRG